MTEKPGPGANGAGRFVLRRPNGVGEWSLVVAVAALGLSAVGYAADWFGGPAAVSLGEDAVKVDVVDTVPVQVVSPSSPAASLVVTIQDHPHRQPVAFTQFLFERCTGYADSISIVLDPSGVSDREAADRLIRTACGAGPGAAAALFTPSTVVFLAVENAGASVARSVSVSVPRLYSADYTPTDGEREIVEWSFRTTDTRLDLGDIRPNERVNITAWLDQGIGGRDTIEVYSDEGSIEIRR